MRVREGIYGVGSCADYILGATGGVVGHVGFADPFDANLAKIVVGCAGVLEGEDVKLHENGTLICMGTLLLLSSSSNFPPASLMF